MRLAVAKPLLLWCAAMIGAAGCGQPRQRADSSGPREPVSAVVDQTHWKVLRPLPRDAVRLRVIVSESSGESRLAEQTRRSLERELKARGFTLDSQSSYTLDVQCIGPWSGTRGFPITSKYLKIALSVSLSKVDDDERFLEGEADGIVDEAAVSPFSGSEHDRVERAVSAAVGKLARYLSTIVIAGSRDAPVLAGSPPGELFPPVPEGERSTVAVIDFSAPEDFLSAGEALADICRDAVSKTGRFRLIDRNNVKAILGEQDFAAVVRCSETSCLVDYGRILHAQTMLHGRLSPIGQKFVLFLSLTDVNTSTVDATEVSAKASSLEELMDLLPQQTWKLIQNASPDNRSSGSK